MKVKKFQAPTMPEAMKKVKKSLGQDAVILNSKEIKVGGFLGMFKKRNIEVIAAVDPVQPLPSDSKRKPAIDIKKKEVPAYNDSEVMRELKQLKTMIQQQSVNELTILDKLAAHLISQEIDSQIVDDLVSILKDEDLQETEGMDASRIELNIKHYFENKVANLPIGSPAFVKKYVHLVGPTGVGKTTTLAKLAADAVLNRNQKVAFITTDTYRIAAIDQLRTYAKLLNIPLEVAYNLEDYMGAREKFASYDLVLIDTAGRNFREAHYVQELERILQFNEDTETYLVLSLASKYEDMKEIFLQFNKIPIHQFIFTKKDETAKLGAALSLSINNQIGIAYVTYGQDVPDDISQADASQLIASVTEGLPHE
ncbi:flagellar biosynthesis protein FlhF [Halobacillus campisalis]|uniref:Flagellar biosynthesis protein FlhF n=1 Tax=Halobacillus campisalis TaxID=435909 RepID=A0ABW2K2X1_9BACI|nr:flagellar biosynthesis protein FlhF [Halobacillus campisalis]